MAILFLLARPVCAQTQSPPAEQGRLFINVNLVGAALSNAAERDFRNSFLQYGEVGTIEARYPKPTNERVAPLLDIEGGLLINRHLGFGIGFSQTVFDDPSTMQIVVPHPFFLNAPGTATANSDPLRRTENFTNIFMTLVALRSGKMEWRFSGGPSIISYAADMVSAISYSQDAPPTSQSNVVTITDYSTQHVSGTSFGAHISTDFAYDIARMVAIAGGVRGSLGTVEIDPEPITKLKQDIRVGSWQLFLGLRFRLGALNAK